MDWQAFSNKLHEIPDHYYVSLSEVFLVVFLTVLTNFLTQKLFTRMELKVRDTETLWDDAFFDAIRKPARMAIWVFGLSIAVNTMDGFAETDLYHYVEPATQIAIIVIIAWFFIRFISGIEQSLANPAKSKKPMDVTTAAAVAKLFRLSVFITAALIIMQTMGYSISGLLAFGGLGGMAVGFAAKDLLANFFGGLMIYMDKPFQVGDWIRSPDREIEGTVEDIGWRLTRIRTFDKRPLYVPNANFASIAVENPSRMRNRRINETFGIRYDDASKLHSIVDDVKQMLIDDPEIDNNQTLIVNFDLYGPYSLDFFIYTFTKTTDWIRFHEIKQDVLFKVMDIVLANGAEFAFPTSTLHLAKDEGPEVAG